MRSLGDVFKRRSATLTMQDIADRLGMTKGNLYHYFSSKKELEYACHPACAPLNDRLQLIDETGCEEIVAFVTGRGGIAVTALRLECEQVLTSWHGGEFGSGYRSHTRSVRLDARF